MNTKEQKEILLKSLNITKTLMLKAGKVFNSKYVIVIPADVYESIMEDIDETIKSINNLEE